MIGDTFDWILGDNPLSVQTLSLSHKELSSLPPALSKLTSLTSLDLSENSLDTLPEYISTLPLTTVNLAKNMFSSVPSALIQCPCLTHVSLEMNFISSVPDTFCTLPNLIQVKLSYNHITELPIIPSVEELYLTSNLLTHIPSTITRMKRLTLLALEHNVSLPGRSLPLLSSDYGRSTASLYRTDGSPESHQDWWYQHQTKFCTRFCDS